MLTKELMQKASEKLGEIARDFPLEGDSGTNFEKESYELFEGV